MTVLPIKGALIATISHGGENCSETIYICPKAKDLYISQTAFKKWRLINKNFPAQFKSEIAATKNVQKATDDILAPCGCLIRSPCPPVPDTLPLFATPEYREELENWIKCYFANNAFNACAHQRLQTITGEPLSISFANL